MQNHNSMCSTLFYCTCRDGQPGWYWDEFDTTVPMPTYLVAFLITEFPNKTLPSISNNRVTGKLLFYFQLVIVILRAIQSGNENFKLVINLLFLSFCKLLHIFYWQQKDNLILWKMTYELFYMIAFGLEGRMAIGLSQCILIFDSGSHTLSALVRPCLGLSPLQCLCSFLPDT